MATYSALVTVFVACFTVSIADVNQGPLNQAELVGDDVVLQCLSSSNGTERVQFRDPKGSIISDGSFLAPGNENYFRYALDADFDNGVYILTLRNASLTDAGRYSCIDINELPNPVSKFAEVVIIASNPVCTTTIPTNNVVNLDQYYTAECLVEFQSSPGIIPSMLWTGSGSFTQGSTSTNSTRFSGLQFNAELVMDSTAFRCSTFFPEDVFGGENTASNVPTWTYVYSTGLVFIQYSPRDLRYEPVKASYEIGNVITCYADAIPLPSYSWTKLPSGQPINSQDVTLLPSDVGDIVLRCQAINTVGSLDLLVNITVNPITTPTTPTTTTPAPTVPAFAECDDLTGRWEYTHDDGYMSVLCLNVDQNRNGLLGGLLWNDTNESYFSELIGRTRLGYYDEIGFSIIWATNDGVSSFAGECYKCYGEEKLILNALTRRTLGHQYCYDGSTGTMASPSWTLTRKPISFPCSAHAATMEQTIRHSQAKLPATRRRRMANNYQV